MPTIVEEQIGEEETTKPSAKKDPPIAEEAKVDAESTKPPAKKGPVEDDDDTTVFDGPLVDQKGLLEWLGF